MKSNKIKIVVSMNCEITEKIEITFIMDVLIILIEKLQHLCAVTALQCRVIIVQLNQNENWEPVERTS